MLKRIWPRIRREFYILICVISVGLICLELGHLRSTVLPNEAELSRLLLETRAVQARDQALAHNGQPIPPYQTIGHGDDLGLIYDTANQITRNAMVEVSAFRKECAEGTATRLTAETLATKAGMSVARKLVISCRDSAARHRAAFLALQASIPEAIEALKVDPSLKLLFEPDLTTRLPRIHDLCRQSWDIDIKRLDVELGQLDLLAHPRGVWRAVNGRFVFSNRADAAKFDRGQALTADLGTQKQAVSTAINLVYNHTTR